MSTSYRVVFGLLLSCATASLAQTGSPKATAPLTEVQALKIAKEFSQNMGHPIVDQNPNREAISPALEPHENQPAATWKYKLYDGKNLIDMDVVAATGVVSQYFNHSDIPDPSPEDAPLSKAQAIVEATAILTKAGAMKTNELKFKDAEESRSSASTTEWYVEWDRACNGIPYRDQGATVTFDADTGRLIGFGVRFRTDPPKSAIANIDKEQAERIAAIQLVGAGLEPGTPSNVSLEVIPPNSFWQTDPSNPETLPNVRVAWICHYKIEGRFYEVWVDRETGQVIGGSQISNAGYTGRFRLKSPAQKAQKFK